MPSFLDSNRSTLPWSLIIRLMHSTPSIVRRVPSLNATSIPPQLAICPRMRSSLERIDIYSPPFVI